MLMSFREKIKNLMQENTYKPITFKEFCKIFEITDKQEIKRFQNTLDDMEKEGEIIQTRYERYGLLEKMNLIVGILQGHAKGFGFLIPDKAGEEDIFLPANELNGALNGDKIVVRLNGEGSRSREGEVIRVLKRANVQVIGKYESSKQFGFVVPDEKRINMDIFIPKGLAQGAKTGDKVVVKINRWPEKRRNPEGEIIQVLGSASDPGIENLSLIKKYGLPEEFPPEVESELRALPNKVYEEDTEGRKDFSNLLTITIDGADAKDLDDAVSLEKNEKGNYVLGVHIADIGHYVPEGSALDKEAYERGTSVYLADRVIPMFPTEISNDLCSLNPHIERVTQSVLMEINHQGKVVDYKFYQSFIKISERMTYDNVRKILVDKDNELTKRYENIIEMLSGMAQLAGLLREKRFHRGAIDFNFPEVKVILDEKGKPTEIKRLERSIAEEMIEEFMLMCNETVAGHFHKLQTPFLYRTHDRPSDEKMVDFRDFIYNLGYRLPGKPEDADSRMLQKVLKEVEGTPEEKVINTILLRSMQQARYSEINSGHFGLAAKNYSHFTSPIRRYPDLVIHRIMKEVLTEGKLDKKKVEKLTKKMPDIARHTSLRERRAMEAERESVDYKKVEFMEDKVGEVFTGVISSVTSFGFFVELENTIEGLIHVSTLDDDYYHFYEKKFLLKGERHGNTFTIGDEVKVKLIKASKEEQQIDFELERSI